MKPLHQMNNLERAYLLARLFPDELKALTEFFKKEAELFISNIEQVFNEWTEQHISADQWFNFIDNFQRRYSRNGTRLYRNKRTFRDQLFDGYDALFTIHSVIHYTYQEQCSQELKHAIYMLFGSQKLINIKLEQTR
ncbi:hypothetical protein SAMN05443633_11258 [Chryseobacterium arachidis]|uniref:Uncharacterized protein n=1 Tax=Chryseobacterium arachidis TaxID=1416778 RepID=A0A1M5I9H2_9FLAO|nr:MULTISPECIES: hypothetical protein [Bacteroidota]QRY55957.1 hypothetical protein JVX97_18230 [Sphingobacterium siyangense]SHG25024.1 hypothetical protein SAMN05443633_11258 [Chryseobacterium arachidis]